MEGPKFFDRLRDAVLALKNTPPKPLIFATYIVYSHPEDRAGVGVPGAPVVEIERDDRTARLKELMAQAMLGAEVPIRSASSAHEVWVPLIVDYVKAGSSSWKWADIPGAHYEKAGGVVTLDCSSIATRIDDLFGVAADFLEQLKTRAMADRAIGHQAVADARQSFAEQLDAAMTARRMSSSELADVTKIHERTIRHYRAGTRVPKRSDVVRGLEGALDTSFQLPKRRARRRLTKRSAKARKSQ